METSYSKIVLESVTKTIFDRGMEYFKDGKVFNLKIEEARTEADVEGTRQDYFVEMEYDDDGFMGDCSCPYMENNHHDYCKHIVAVAIARDNRLGLPLPTKAEIETLTIEEFPHLGQKLAQAYEKPLEADLTAIARATDFSSWVRPHAKITIEPYIFPGDASNLVKIKRAYGQIRTLENKYKYDHYFCAGEVTAVAAMTLDLILAGMEKLENSLKKEIFHETVKFYYKVYLNMIDGSDGVWQIVQARVKKMATLGDFSDLKEKLNKEITGWGDVLEDLH